MDWLNHHHLLYSWMVAREGSIACACLQLHPAPLKTSSQPPTLEASIGEKLFKRWGGVFVLMGTGQLRFRYADDMLARRGELSDVLRGTPTGSRPRLSVSMADVRRIQNTSLPRAMDQWRGPEGIRPRVVRGCEKSALLQLRGAASVGLFAKPSKNGEDVCRQHRVRSLGELSTVREREDLISPERNLAHLAVAAISEVARQGLFL